MTWRAVPRIGAALTIGLQICWPLASGDIRAGLTAITVVLFAATSVSHAWINRGTRWALQFFVTTVVFAIVVEAIGVWSGLPFGHYTYGSSLGPQLLGVPLLIPLAWAMAAYPALLLARRLGTHPVSVVVIGAFALTSWDLFLDPQMVSQGYWTWSNVGLTLPGVQLIPATNFLGWFVASLILMLLLAPLPATRAAEGVPAILWAWTWVGGVVANACFFGRVPVALWGGLAMGLVTVPYLLALNRDRADDGEGRPQCHEQAR
ncbi:MAG: carotenoid biosynthesis protein [Actinomycetes bacterium]